MNWFKSLFGRHSEPNPPPTDDPKRGSRPPEAPETEIAVAPSQSPHADKVDAIETGWGKHEVHLMELGQPAEPVVAFLNNMITKYETPQAIEFLARQNMARKQPILVGLSADSAEDVVVRLERLGANARAYHADDPNKPVYSHNLYGVVLVDAGLNAKAVARKLQTMLRMDVFAAWQLVKGAPSVIVRNMSVDEAFAVMEWLRPLGAELDLLEPERNDWLDTSTDHIHPAAGPYRLVLQHAGETQLPLKDIVAGLRPDLDASAVADLLDHLPAVLLTDVDLPTAELAAMKLRDFGGTAVWQQHYDADARLHPQSPTFGVGELTVVLEGYDGFAKVRLVKWLLETRPGMRLTDVMPLLEDLPAFVADEVDMVTAVRLLDELIALNATASVLDADGTVVG